NKVGSNKPDGSYALYRVGDGEVELLTDQMSSRSIWYYFDEERLIASSSQRALAMLLGSFEPETSNYPWMLSAGKLRFMHAWDRRVKRLPLNSRLHLVRRDWQLKIESQPFEFDKMVATEEEHETQFAQSMQDTFSELNIDLDRWLVPLSGGYDSRGIALGLSKHKPINTIAWGTPETANNPKGDNWIAERVSRKLNTRHQLYPLDSAINVQNIDVIIDRFLRNSEGQVDHISSYMDGFKLWKDIFESNYHGVIRGDVAFSATTFKSAWDGFITRSLLTLAEYSNTKRLEHVLRELPQERHPSLSPLPGESMVGFTQRTIGTYYVTMISVPLNDLKSVYCEVLTPLLAKNVVSAFNQLPEHMMASRKLYKKIITDQLPEIEIAQNAAIESKVRIVNSPEISAHILSYLHENRGTPLFSDAVYSELLDFVETHADPEKAARPPSLLFRVIRKLRKIVGRQIQSLDPMLLGFRLYIILKSHTLFSEDAKALRLH
ncbi:MAG: hypothetical protein AAF420_08530, partial [Pseudomonadota bacterium]